MSTTTDVPSTILIVGSGVFGLGTAYALTQRPEYKNTTITLLERLPFPPHDASSVDSSRIVRPDYPDAAYAELAVEAQRLWRGDFGAEGRYNESGLCIISENEKDTAAENFLRDTLKNVQEKLGLKVGPREEGGELTVLKDSRAVEEVMGGIGGNVAKHGYVNWTSGWADAEAGMRYLRKEAEETGRIDFRTAEIRRLMIRACTNVVGAETVDGEKFTADLTILATGAWTPKFIDLRGRASASGQSLGYIALSQEEQDRLGKNPVFLNETNGIYIIPPRDRVLKIARHGYGYANPTTIFDPESSDGRSQITVSLPRTKENIPGLGIPAEATTEYREYLSRVLPELANRPWAKTRLCWYTDTASSDWIIDYHPQYHGLFVATGGSGHAYKFLPVIGNRVVDILLDQNRDDLGVQLRTKWQWPKEKFHSDHIWTDDWRGGPKGMILDEEFAKDITIKEG